MKAIINLLELDANSTEAEVIAALNTRLSRHAEAVAEIEKLRELTKAGGLPKSITPALLEQKLAAGLPKDKAIDVLLEQAAHDKTKPHDALPGEESDKKKK